MRRLSFLFAVIVLLASSIQLIANTKDADAILTSGQGWYSGYFYGNSANGHYDVILYGLPESAGTSKAGFINFVLGKYNTSYSQATINTIAPSNPGFQPAMDKMGAAYIIQTMRGGTDHGFPDAADIADWQAKIYNPSVTIEWGTYINTYNSARSNKVNGVRDVYGYIGDGTYHRSVLFKVNGTLVYAVKQLCANPMGSLPGLPNPINFSLTPTISVTPKTAEPLNGSATATPTVNNTGSTTSSAAQWQVTSFILDPTDSIPTAAQNGTTPTSYYGHGATVIRSGNQAFNRGATTLPVATLPIPDRPVGTKVCFALSVQPYTHTSGNWSHGVPSCVTISKKPKVQVLGGDLMVGRKSASVNEAKVSTINTSTTMKAGAVYGSWGEYALIASGRVMGMASGAGYAGGAPAADLCALSLLTFTSGATTGPGCGATIGNYVQTTTAPNIAARFPINVSSDVATPGNPASPAALPSTTVNLTADNLSGVYQAPKNANQIVISGGVNIPKGRWIVINAPNAKITITGNITYTNEALGSLYDIPQVILIGKNIIISDAVTQIDAWLVAVGDDTEGRINTCGASANGSINENNNLVYTQCANTLTINGPIIAKELSLRRTGGSGTGDSSGDPAEVLNLRADAYLWGVDYNTREGKLPTVSTKELPPRF